MDMSYDRWFETKYGRKWNVTRIRYSKFKPKKMKGKIKAKQYAIKRNQNQYDLITKGTKKRR